MADGISISQNHLYVRTTQTFTSTKDLRYWDLVAPCTRKTGGGSSLCQTGKHTGLSLFANMHIYEFEMRATDTRQSCQVLPPGVGQENKPKHASSSRKALINYGSREIATAENIKTFSLISHNRGAYLFIIPPGIPNVRVASTQFLAWFAEFRNIRATL